MNISAFLLFRLFLLLFVFRCRFRLILAPSVAIVEEFERLLPSFTIFSPAIPLFAFHLYLSNMHFVDIHRQRMPTLLLLRGTAIAFV